MTPEDMNPPEDDRAAIRALLETLLRQQGAADVPETDDLVRWLEGTLPAERNATVETALARHPALRQGLVALRRAETEAVTVDELARLEALVPLTVAPVMAFPATLRAGGQLGYWLAAAAAVALLVPAWTIGMKLAEQRTEVETRSMRVFLRSASLKGGL